MPFCVLCKSYFLKFVSFNNRPNAGCPNCKTAERHRLLGYYIENNISKGNLIIYHLTPEEHLRKIMSTFAKEYICENVTDKIDCSIYPDQRFNLIIASHILDHLQNDLNVLNEFFRILMPSGKLIIMSPQNFNSTITDEDTTITNPVDREKKYGQFDRIRMYGLDLSKKLRQAHFFVKAYVPIDRISETKQMDLDSMIVIADHFVMADNGFSEWDILYECTRVK